MKIAFTKPTRRFTVPGFSKIDRPLVDEVVEFSTKNLNVEFVKFEMKEVLLFSSMTG